MPEMRANTRLALCAAVILVSALYAVLVEKDQQLAETLAIGYVAVLMTALVLVNFWKKT